MTLENHRIQYLDKRYKAEGYALTVEHKLNALISSCPQDSLSQAELARCIASIVHEGAIRQSSGAPYTVHTDYVANFKKVARPYDFSILQQTVGHLHDTKEDSPLDDNDLIYLGVEPDAVKYVDVLTTNRIPHFDGIENIIDFQVTRTSKELDIEHNASDQNEFKEDLFNSIQEEGSQVIMFEDFLANDGKDLFSITRNQRRLIARDFQWSYRNPVSLAFIQAANKDEKYMTMSTPDFLEDEACPNHLRGIAKLAKIQSVMRMRLTGYPLN